MKLDIKSMVIGVMGCCLLMFVSGYTSTANDTHFFSSAVTWAMVVPPNAKVLARGADGKAFIIDVNNSTATKIEYDPRKLSLMNDIVFLGGKN